jgi:hypothetical protein
MKRLIIVTVLAIAGLATVCAEDAPIKKQPATQYEYEAIRAGDQYLNLNAGPTFPLFYLTPNGLNTSTRLNIGGMGGIGYSRFITPNISIGGEFNFAFNTTFGQNLFFYLPMFFKGTYELVFWQIHVPLSLNVGMAFQTFNSYSYFGPAVKPEIGVYYQFSPEWSFGGSCGWTVLPQWYQESANNRTGNMFNVVAGFRYHF